MVNREDRAKQFLSFDALSGLKEELRRREEKFLRVEKREITEERAVELSAMLASIVKGDKINVTFYYKGVYVNVCGVVMAINTAFKYIIINQNKIAFSDIYQIERNVNA